MRSPNPIPGAFPRLLPVSVIVTLLSCILSSLHCQAQDAPSWIILGFNPNYGPWLAGDEVGAAPEKVPVARQG